MPGAPDQRGDVPADSARTSAPTARRIWRVVRPLLSLFSVVLSLVFVIAMVAFAFAQPYVWFAWHPICMGLYLALAVWGVLILAEPDGVPTAISKEEGDGRQPLLQGPVAPSYGAAGDRDAEGGSPAAQPTPGAFGLGRKTRLTLHLVLHCLAVALCLGGLAVAVAFKLVNAKSHFTTWHAILGLVGTCLSSLQLVWGFLAKNDSALGQWAARTGRSNAFQAFRRWHRRSGILVAIGVAIAVSALGMYEHWTMGGIAGLFGREVPMGLVQGLLVGLLVAMFLGTAAQGGLRH
ncbi:hypothetical protein DFJ74DRAFT_670546 [Hyaloraphidium curvatum]|nr:hypothetical protein DFJ74DRAFT_670546 [Hyaloraphidium curvatum]